MSDSVKVDSKHVVIISSDGHATARMDDYLPYLPSQYHEEFRAFCDVYRELGSRNFDPPNLSRRTDDEVVADWTRDIVDEGRLEGNSDPQQRLIELDRDGVSAEVLFPDFGLPFELYSPFLASARGYTRSVEQVDVGNKAYNRWLADFCAQSPDRFGGMAAMSFHDVDEAVKEIRWAKEAGLKGILLPMFEDTVPLFDPRFDVIWSTLEELEMPANSHSGMSSTTATFPGVPPLPHPSCGIPIFGAQLFFFCHQILNHLIWGGVLERHPSLQVAFTEQGSGWVVGDLEAMDYSYEGSYLRRDVREVVKRRPSEYFERQCHLGSSIFSRSEIEARSRIGVHKMALGMDYPHHEGTWWEGTKNYLQATLGLAGVPPDEADMMLCTNAAELWGFDVAALRPIAARSGMPMADILRAPVENLFPRGDVNKPLGAAFI